jgi:hypothetical protein
MKRALFLLLGFSLALTSVVAQDITTAFEIVAPRYQPVNSLYRTIGFLDSRKQKLPIGIVGTGVIGHLPAKLVLKSPVGPELVSLLDSITDQNAGTGELLFQLRRFGFVEETSSRYCYLCASLYARSGEGYRPLSTLDTVILLRSVYLQEELEIKANGLLTDFVERALMMRSTDSAVYTLSDVEHIDSIEKSRLPVYTTTRYVDGVYSNFTSFARMEPDVPAIVKTHKNGTISSVRKIDSAGRKERVDRKKIYAVVSGGRIFIVTEFGYYPVQRVGKEFIFVGDVRVAPSTGDKMSGVFALGLVGLAEVAWGVEKTYQLSIDHLNGQLVHLHVLGLATN